jgi:uracil-DNA glycosylase
VGAVGAWLAVKQITDGSPSASVWIVGEAPGADEVERGRPFVGASGMELDAMLREAGLDRRECFLTNVCHERPPSYQRNGKWVHNDIDQWFLGKTRAKTEGICAVASRYPAGPITGGIEELRSALAIHRPILCIALGNTPLWALTGHTGITKWRGSVFDTREARDTGPAAVGGKVICTFHPADVLRQWTHRPIVVQDFRRALRESAYSKVRKPTWHFTIPTSTAEVFDWFRTFSRDELVCDTEGWGRVDCIGFAASSQHAICIPFAHETGVGDTLENLHYWSVEDECVLTLFLREILTTRSVVFHNALWDCQVIARRWGFLPRLGGDTQAMQHVCFPGLLGGRIDPVTGEVAKTGSSLSLSFLASMYCDYYRYWKDDGRHFDPSVGDERDYWYYNCEDCVRTYDCHDKLSDIIDASALREQYEHVMRRFGPIFAMMFRGIRYNRARARSLREDVDGAARAARMWLNTTVGHDFNPESTPQMRALFYEDLALPLILKKDTKAPTLDDAALETIARKNPLLRPLVAQIQNYRTLDTVKGDLDPDMCSELDGRLRFALNNAFVETMRFSCNETAFGEGGNVQNIKRPDED